MGRKQERLRFWPDCFGDTLSAQRLAGMGSYSNFSVFMYFSSWLFGNLGDYLFHNQKENRKTQYNIKAKTTE